MSLFKDKVKGVFFLNTVYIYTHKNIPYVTITTTKSSYHSLYSKAMHVSK